MSRTSSATSETLTTRYRTSSPLTWTNNFFTISPLIFPAPEPFVCAIVTSCAYSLCAGNGAGLIRVRRLDYAPTTDQLRETARVRRTKERAHLCFIRYIPRIPKPIPQPLQAFSVHPAYLGDGLVEYLESDAEFERDV